MDAVGQRLKLELSSQKFYRCLLKTNSSTISASAKVDFFFHFYFKPLSKISNSVLTRHIESKRESLIFSSLIYIYMQPTTLRMKYYCENYLPFNQRQYEPNLVLEKGSMEAKQKIECFSKSVIIRDPFY